MPVLNENSLIEELINRIKLSVEIITQEFEILIVDDGSEDSTWEKIEAEAIVEKRVKGIKLSRNFGHHYAITAGLHKSIGDWVVVMDGDLQDRPEVIPKLYFKAQEGFDIVFVSRQNRPEKIYYRAAQKFFYWTLNVLSGLSFDSSQANFSIISKKVVKAYKDFPENARFYGATIKWLGFNRSQVFAEHGHRFSGESSYSLKKRLKLATDIIISFSNRPLKFAIKIGFISSVLSIVLATTAVFQKLFYDSPVFGWTSLFASIFFIGGIILTMLVIIGVYLLSISQEIKGRPLFVIQDTINL